MNIRLVYPSEEYEEKIMAYRLDFIKHGDSMDGTAGLQTAESFKDWFAAWNDNRFDKTVRKGLVPATTFLAVDENNNLLGMIDIRHKLNDRLMSSGGHVGYSVLRSERQKGIASKMLALALDECRKLGLSMLLITCQKDNIASAKTILKNGGVLENEVAEDGRLFQRYWIRL